MNKTSVFPLITLFLCFVFVNVLCQSNKQIALKVDILNQKEINQLVTEAFKKEFVVNFPVSRIYRYADKSGLHYIILTEKFDGRDERDTLHHQIKALCFVTVGNKMEKQWELNDYTIKQTNGEGTETSIWFWTKYINLKDIDKDGLVDPIIIYGSAGLNGTDDGRIKIIIFYKGQKFAIRHQNGILDEERNTQIDEGFYSLPIELHSSVENLMRRMMKDRVAIFPGYWEEAMKKHKIKIEDKK